MLKKLCLLTALTLFSTNSSADTVDGWFLTGSNPSGYEFSTDENEGFPAPSGHYYSSDSSTPNQFGTVMQYFFPEEYLGKRVKMTAWVKSKNIEEWSGLWMRIDDKDNKTVSFDNMHNRAIKNTTPWTQYSIVLDVPSDAMRLSYGILITGAGEVWVDEFNFLAVNNNVEVTDLKSKQEPKNFKKSPINNQF